MPTRSQSRSTAASPGAAAATNEADDETTELEQHSAAVPSTSMEAMLQQILQGQAEIRARLDALEIQRPLSQSLLQPMVNSATLQGV